MKFDWYQATIDEDSKSVVSMLLKSGDNLEPCDSLAKKMAFGSGVHVLREGLTISTVLWGGHNKVTHAWASSDNTPKFVDVVRNEWPDNHTVSRMDSCQDFGGSFEDMRQECLKVAKKHYIRFPQYIDELDDEAGRTQYMGSAKSAIRVRCYEKGKEVWNKTRHYRNMAIPEATIILEDTGEIVDFKEWNRLECQVRPKGEEARIKAAHCTPEDAWSFTTWTHELAKEVLNLHLPRIHVNQHKMTDDERALYFMVKQYGKVISRTASKLGGFSEFGLHLQDLIKHRELR